MDAGTREALEARIAALLDGADPAGAVTAAIRGYGGELHGYLCSVLRDESAAWEVFSALCEDLWRGAPGFRRESSFRTWAYRLAWHAAARHLRDPFRRRGERLATTAAGQLADELRSTGVIRRQAQVDSLAELRALLDPEEQTLLVLRVEQELPWSDIAAVLGDAEPALRKRFQRLKDRLRDEARARGLLDA
jgi:RNA polymerase sigma-70 factor (ECF subfamily)